LILIWLAVSGLGQTFQNLSKPFKFRGLAAWNLRRSQRQMRVFGDDTPDMRQELLEKVKSAIHDEGAATASV
jgi:hypothetical protein